MSRPRLSMYDPAMLRTRALVQAEDTQIGAKNLFAIDVFCHQGLVVLTGVVESGSKASRR